MVGTNAYTTATGNSNGINPIVWSPESEKYIYEKSVFQGLGKQNPSQLNKPGKQYVYSFGTKSSMGALTEGVDIPISSLSYTQVNVYFYAYGDAKQVTDEEIAQGFSFLINDIKYNALGAWAENRDSQIVTELMNTTATGIYPGSAASATIVAGDVLTRDVISKVVTTMEESQAKKCMYLVIHPRQKNSLMKDDDFMTIDKYGDPSLAVTGELGTTTLGVKVLVSNHITTATENSITVYKAIALGRDPFVFMPKRNFVFNVEYETLRSRAVTFSWWEMFGVKILRNESVIILTSAGGY